MADGMKVTLLSGDETSLRLRVDPDEFGRLFATMSDAAQVEVFRAMHEHMKTQSMQWDFIAILLENPENASLRQHFQQLFTQETA